MGATALETTTQLVNRNLISLKFVLFIVYGGLASLYSTLIPHMLQLGLNYNESRIILIFAPLISILGPLLVAPLADRLASTKQALSGQYLRILIAVSLVLATVAYSTLLAVPEISRSASRRPDVSFGCDSQGAIIFQERCSDAKTCYHWEVEKVGSLVLTNCSYTCQNPSQFEKLSTRGPASDTILAEELASSTETLSQERSDSNDYGYDDYEGVDAGRRTRRQAAAEKAPKVEPPHLCELRKAEDGITTVVDKCHAFTPARRSITVQATLRSATNLENDTHSAEWCTYPLDGFQCHVPEMEVNWMKLYLNNRDCKPMVECQVLDPYDTPGSVLAESQCITVSYLIPA